jgi:hypothetical protein
MAAVHGSGFGYTTLLHSMPKFYANKIESKSSCFLFGSVKLKMEIYTTRKVEHLNQPKR